MTKVLKRAWLVSCVVVVMAACVILIVKITEEKVGIVRTDAIIEGYKGMEDARAALEKRKSALKREMDTLDKDYRSTVSELGDAWLQLTKDERKERGELARVQRDNVKRYVLSVEAQIQAEEEELVSGVLNQINESVRNYAEHNGFDVIFGATSDGSVLFAEEYLDVTDEVLDELNRHYSAPSTQ